MSTISVTIEKTSNNAILKFVSKQIDIKGSYEFNNIDEAKQSPLAQQLFYLPFVKKVYLTANFIALERYDIVTWDDVQEEVKDQIVHYLNNDGAVIIDDSPTKKIAIEVYAESTPNPSVMKFVTNKLLAKTPFEFKNIEETKAAPLAKELFTFPFIKEIFILENYVSITKFDIVEWQDIIVELRSFIREYIADGKVVLTPSTKTILSEEKNSATTSKTLDDVSKQIIEILEEHVQPAVASDGGNIAFKSFNATSKTVEVILQGACSGCPSSTMTLKNGIEALLKDMLPDQINEVVAING